MRAADQAETDAVAIPPAANYRVPPGHQKSCDDEERQQVCDEIAHWHRSWTLPCQAAGTSPSVKTTQLFAWLPVPGHYEDARLLGISRAPVAASQSCAWFNPEAPFKFREVHGYCHDHSDKCDLADQPTDLS